MLHTFEAVIDSDGKIRPLEETNLPVGHRAFVTVLDEESHGLVSETVLLSERSLAEDWNRPEEDEAWSYLQSEQ
ncbi:MAG: hypothetical protein JO314_04470 [Acidobacteria bacterium]|nr:hypothetical protein [Acidobacteriota bacterium]